MDMHYSCTYRAIMLTEGNCIMSTPNNGSNISPITSIIKSVMTDAANEGSRQATLTIALFDSEVSFGKASIEKFARLTGEQRTTALDKMIYVYSDEFSATVTQYEHLTDKDNKKLVTDKAKKRVNALEAELIMKRIRAVRIMFQRAIEGAYGARAIEATQLKAHSTRKGVIITYVNEKEDDGTFSKVKYEYSGRELQAKGATALNKAIGKAPKVTTARSPLASSMADAAKALTSTVASLDNTKVRDVIEGESELATNLAVTFKRLFAGHFADDKGNIDLDAVHTYISAQFKDVVKKAA